MIDFDFIAITVGSVLFETLIRDKREMHIKRINVSKRTEPTVIAIKSKSIKWYCSYLQKIFLTYGGKYIGSLKKENFSIGSLKKKTFFLKRSTSGMVR